MTSFVTNELLWQTVTSRVKSATHVDAAIAYFGRGGSKRIPLKKGDRLVTDMSLATVQSGITDPYEVEKLVQRKVLVFTRRNLHAKVVVADACVVAGSANASKHSFDVLDEAAILTNDPVAIRRAKEFIDRLCTEPISPEYLEECKRQYKPPRFKGQGANGKLAQARTSHAKLWIVNLYDASIPNPEIERYEQGEKQAKERVRDESKFKTTSFHWPHKPKMASELELGDWIIEVITHKDKTIDVYPPGRLLLTDHYVRDAASGKERWVFHLEVPQRRQSMTWKAFRIGAKSVFEKGYLHFPRTVPIRDVIVADGLLKLWTFGGRVSQR